MCSAFEEKKSMNAFRASIMALVQSRLTASLGRFVCGSQKCIELPYNMFLIFFRSLSSLVATSEQERRLSGGQSVTESHPRSAISTPLLISYHMRLRSQQLHYCCSPAGQGIARITGHATLHLTRGGATNYWRKIELVK